MIPKISRRCRKGTKLRILTLGLILASGGLLFTLEHVHRVQKSVATHVSTVRKISSKGIEPEDPDSGFNFAAKNYQNIEVVVATNKNPNLIETNSFLNFGTENNHLKGETVGKRPKQETAKAKLSKSQNCTTSFHPTIIDGATEPEKQFLGSMKKRMTNRRKHLQQTCQKLGLTPDNSTFRLWETDIPKPKPWTFLSKKYKFIYSEIPKSGCSNWKSVLMVLEGKVNATDLNNPNANLNPHASGLRGVKFRGLSKADEAIYFNATKLVVVREPMERLVSAYLDKVAPKPPSNASVFLKFSWEVAKRYGDRWIDPTSCKLDYKNGMREVRVCDSYVAELRCTGPYQVIRILSATYGRMDNKTCGFESSRNWDGKACFSKYAYFLTSQLCDGNSYCDVIASPLQIRMESCAAAKKELSILYTCISIKDTNIVTICPKESHTIKCPTGGVISIASAFYGRLNSKTCSFKAAILNTNCDAPTATSAVMSACQFQSSCEVHARKEWIQSDSCPATSKYIQVWYNCVSQQQAKAKKELHQIPLPLGEKKHSFKPQALYETIRTEYARRQGVADDKLGLPVKASKADPNLPFVVPPIYQPPKYIYRRYNLSATFKEFVAYLLDPLNADVTRDVIEHGAPTLKMTSVRHWQSFYSLTYPCHFDYDVIAHMETIDDDARYLLNRIGAPSNLHYPHGYNKESGKSSTTPNRVIELFKAISDEDIKKLLKLYAIDYEMFGYKYPDLR